jgi:hypothetical protein
VHLTGNEIAGNVSITLGDASTYDAVGRNEYLARAFAASDSRIDGRRASAGLDHEQIQRIRHLLPPVPAELREMPPGELVALTGPLGAGKSDIAEGWLRAGIELAQAKTDAPVPIWVQIDDLDSSLDLHVRKELGMSTLQNAGADIVVDGLDQRADRAEKVISQASSFIARWPRSRILLTSRATHGVRTSRVLEVRPLSKTEGRQLVSLVAGVARIGDMTAQIEESISRPLFALLVGQQSSVEQLTTMTEVIDGVVRKIVGSENRDLYAQLRHLAVETLTHGRPVDPESFASFDLAEQLRNSPFLTVTDRGVLFPLATLEQWFASRALLEGTVQLEDVVVDLVSFDRWKYVLSMVLAAGEPSRVDPLMAKIARWNPGAIAWIIKETESAGLARSQRNFTQEDQRDIGERLRLAVGSLLDGLGPLSVAFTPYWVAGIRTLDDLSLSVHAWDSRVSTTWYISREFPDQPLPPVVDASSLPRVNRSVFSKTASAPVSRNWVWTAARNILASDLSDCFTTLAIRVAAQSDGVVRSEFNDHLKRNLQYPTSIEDVGRNLYGSLYPLPDIPPGNSGWPEFSVDAMTDRILAVMQATIDCYKELCNTVAPNFGDTLAHQGLMPFVYYGNIIYNRSKERGAFDIGPSEAWLKWLLRPVGVSLPNGERSGENTVNITVNDDARMREIDDNYDAFGDAYFLYLANTPGLEPFGNSFSVSSGRFSLIDKKPATHLALGWLWQDLQNLGLVTGMMPPDKTE